jgi:hypothetical protein
MNKSTNAILTIEKELLDSIQFPKNEVLTEPNLIEDRMAQAKRAMMRGNSPYNSNVKILFEDKEGKKMVETTVWGVTEKYILLKRGMSLPLHRIHEIII